MVLFLERKWPCPILAICLTVAIMGLFTFAAAEPLRSVDSWDDAPFSGNFFTSIDITIDCLAEDETIMSRARGGSFSPLRSGALMPVGFQNTGLVFMQSSLKKSENINRPTIKNGLPLKLRT